jgi:hypothetical protein
MPITLAQKSKQAFKREGCEGPSVPEHREDPDQTDICPAAEICEEGAPVLPEYSHNVYVQYRLQLWSQYYITAL